MSTDCNKTAGRLQEYIDAELDPTIAAEVRAHLDECKPCCGGYEFEQRLKGVIRRHLAEDEVPVGLLDRVQKLIADEATNPSS